MLNPDLTVLRSKAMLVQPSSQSLMSLACGAMLATVFGCGGTKAERESKPIVTLGSSSNASSPTPKPDGVIPQFRIVGREAGLDFERFDDISGRRRILEANGGGVALCDFDRDGLLDVVFTNGCQLPLSQNDRAHQGAFFRNLGEMRFQNSTAPAMWNQYGYAYGCAAGDFDADGFTDLYVTAFGRNSFWRNHGDGTWSDITDATGTGVPQWSSSAAFYDLNADGFLDLYVANYLDESDETPRLCPNSRSPDGYEGCSPAIFEGVDDVLFLSNGEGAFIDASERSGIAGFKGKGLGVVIGDLNADQRPEIYVANDGQANFLFVAAGEPSPGSAGGPPLVRWKEQALASNAAVNELGHAQASMGIAAGDIDRDGTTDLFLTHFFGDSNTLYENRGDLAFDDATRSSNLGVASRKTLGFGTVFVDADNDGWLDLFIANGHVDDRTWMADDEPYRMHPQMFRNETDGEFRDVSAWSGDYFASEWVGRGVAAGDLDRDGRIDLAVSHQLAPSVVLHNQTEPQGEAIVLRLVSSTANRDGFGARVEIVGAEPAIVREVFGGGSFQSASATELHCMLPLKKSAMVQIRWPSGKTERHDGFSAGNWILVEDCRPLRPFHVLQAKPADTNATEILNQ